MIKKICIICIVLSMCFSCRVFGYEYYEYDCETGEERIIEIQDLGSSMLENESISMLDNYPTLKECSTYSILPGNALGRITSLAWPHKSIMCLRLGRDNDGDGDIDNWALGTGFLVGPDLMLTAGHCMYNDTGGNVEQMRVYYLQNSTSFQSYCYPSSWITPTEFKNGDLNYDWCLVKLSKSLGTSYGYFDVQIPTGSVNEVTVCGYPDYSSYHYFQYASFGSMSLYGSYGIRYNCSTLGGMSGAPVFDSNTNVVYGIHRAGGTSYNYGTKITQRIINLINSY